MLLRLRLAVLRSMDNRQDNNFIPLLVHLVDDDVRPFEKFAGSVDQSGAAHVGQLRNFEPHHLGFARDYFDCSTGVVFGDPRKYAVELSAPQRDRM